MMSICEQEENENKKPIITFVIAASTLLSRMNNNPPSAAPLPFLSSQRRIPTLQRLPQHRILTLQLLNNNLRLQRPLRLMRPPQKPRKIRQFTLHIHNTLPQRRIRLPLLRELVRIALVYVYRADAVFVRIHPQTLQYLLEDGFVV